jgi:hypothetical protein
MVVMTGVVVSPLVPPVATPDGHRGRAIARAGRRPLPVPRLAVSRLRSTVYRLAAVDDRGRIAGHAVVRALGWGSGTRLDVHESCGLVLVRADQQGVFSVTNQGHLRLPATVRHWCGLVPGDRVLLAANPDRGLLVVYPPVALDAMVSQFHTDVLGGDAG